MNAKKLFVITVSSVLLYASSALSDSWSTNSFGVTSGTMGGHPFSSSTNSLTV